MDTRKLAAFGLTAALIASGGPVLAIDAKEPSPSTTDTQKSMPAQPPGGGSGTSGQSTESGRTSGPAAGAPTTMGSTPGKSLETPHQSGVVREQSGSVRGQEEKGSGSTQPPTAPSAKPDEGKSDAK